MKVDLSEAERQLLLAHAETSRLTREILDKNNGESDTNCLRDQLREACSDLLQRIGFDEHYTPTEAGVALERLIDRLLIR